MNTFTITYVYIQFTRHGGHWPRTQVGGAVTGNCNANSSTLYSCCYLQYIT